MIIFHRFLIGTFILFSLAFAVWAFASFASNSDAIMLALGIFFALATVAFSYYHKNLKRFLGL